MASLRRVTISIPERNRQILQLRKEGLSQTEVARRFKLSPSRIYLIEKQDAAEKSLADRRTKLREDIRAADDPDKLWPVEDLLDAVGLIVVTKKRLMDHFKALGKLQISLRELMDMCLDAPVVGRDWMSPSLYRVRGVGKIGFWSLVNGLAGMDLGSRCNEEWQKGLAKVKEEHQVTGETPYSSPIS
jgi:transcriptional regulator with XRE-family HTH domain